MPQSYIRRVDRVLKNLREHLLGLDTRLEVLLPWDMKNETAEQKAAWLADRLLFCLAAEEALEEEELRNSRSWLYEAILYLLMEVDECDHDLANILKLFGLPPEVREIILAAAGDPGRFPHMRSDRRPPIGQEDLEAAMLRLEPRICRVEIYERLCHTVLHNYGFGLL